MRGRIPGLYPGHTIHFVFDNDESVCPAPVQLTVGRLLKNSDHYSLLEAIVSVPLGIGDHHDATIEDYGLVIVPNYLVAPAHNGRMLMAPVFRWDRDCELEAWREARERCSAVIRLCFHPVHPARTMRVADHVMDIEDPVRRVTSKPRSYEE